MLNRIFAVAPMLDWTDRHCRYFYRLMTKEVLLYTEMVVSEAVLYKSRDKVLAYNSREKPVALQLGGCDPIKLAEATKIACDHGYDEINLNVGCPSNRVQAGKFGACLMAEPELVAECVAAMQKSAGYIPVTVKTRLGIDEHEGYDFLAKFITKVADTGCDTFILHARKAWLKGLNPKQNREIPPLQYDIAKLIKANFPQLKIVLNGGINDLIEAKQHLTDFDGVMLGRAVYHNPFLLAEVDEKIYGKSANKITRLDVLDQMLPYIEDQIRQGVVITSITRHLVDLFHGMPKAKQWRQALSNYNKTSKFDLDSFREAVQMMR